MDIVSNTDEPLAKKIRPADAVMCGYDENEKQLETLITNIESPQNLESTDNKDERMFSKCNDEDEDLFPFPPDNDIAEMVEGVQYCGSFPTITDRYFTAYYKLDVQSPMDDICILLHSNRICMLTLAPTHAALRRNKEVTKVDFKVSEKLDRAMNKVSGKSKHGAQPLQTNSNICTISCSNGDAYTIKCCLIGKLVEVNEALLENPGLLYEPPHRGGYLAIVLPNIKLLEKMKSALITQEEYRVVISERESGGSKKGDGLDECNDCEKKESCTSDVPLAKNLDREENSEVIQ